MITNFTLKTRLFFLATLLCFSDYSAQIKERLPCVDKKVSVVAHIFYDSLGNTNTTESEILQAFNIVNKDFAPICISFEVCEFLYHENYQYDEHEQPLDWLEMQHLYHVNHRLNVYYVTNINVPLGACGFAGLGAIQDPYKDGVVIKKLCCAPTVKTHSHELGHYFGLEHTWMAGGTDELVDGSNCSTAGDRICDTPADPYVQGPPMTTWLSNCRFIYTTKDANGDYYDPFVGNIMSYYPDECSCGFTDDQFRRMAQTYLNGSQHW